MRHTLDIDDSDGPGVATALLLALALLGSPMTARASCLGTLDRLLQSGMPVADGWVEAMRSALAPMAASRGESFARVLAAIDARRTEFDRLVAREVALMLAGVRPVNPSLLIPTLPGISDADATMYRAVLYATIEREAASALQRRGIAPYPAALRAILGNGTPVDKIAVLVHMPVPPGANETLVAEAVRRLRGPELSGKPTIILGSSLFPVPVELQGLGVIAYSPHGLFLVPVGGELSGQFQLNARDYYVMGGFCDECAAATAVQLATLGCGSPRIHFPAKTVYVTGGSLFEAYRREADVEAFLRRTVVDPFLRKGPRFTFVRFEYGVRPGLPITAVFRLGTKEVRIVIEE